MENVICTVLIISYNHVKYIQRAIESVLMQNTTYHYVIHICDDGSTDGTKDIIIEYAKLFPEKIIPYLQDKNRGAKENIWDAFKSVNTEYCAYLEGDDYWCDSNKLQLQIDALENNPECSFCSHNTLCLWNGDAFRKRENSTLLVNNRLVRETGVYSGTNFTELYAAGWMNHVNSRLIRMSIVSLDELTDKEDFLYDNAQFFYLLQRGNLFFYKQAMSVYIMNDSGVFSSDSVQNKVRNHWNVMLHINETTNREFEKLILLHLSSFTKYWFNLLDINSGVQKYIPPLISQIRRSWKKLRYDYFYNKKIIKKANSNIEILNNRIRKDRAE